MAEGLCTRHRAYRLLGRRLTTRTMENKGQVESNDEDGIDRLLFLVLTQSAFISAALATLVTASLLLDGGSGKSSYTRVQWDLDSASRMHVILYSCKYTRVHTASSLLSDFRPGGRFMLTRRVETRSETKSSRGRYGIFTRHLGPRKLGPRRSCESPTCCNSCRNVSPWHSMAWTRQDSAGAAC